MRRALVALSLVAFLRCASPAPPAPVEVEPVAPAPAPAARPAEERVLRTVRVTASALNVRAEASTDASVVAQVKRGTSLDVLREDASWMKVRLASGETGWVASRFVSGGGESARRAAPSTTRRGGCPPDSDYAFLETPRLAFSDSGARGLVVVEATVNAKGSVTSTKVVSNGTGDPALAVLAEREIQGAKFSPPIRDCVARAFIFTYRRTF